MKRAWRHLLVLIPAALIATGCAGIRGTGDGLDVNAGLMAPDQRDALLAQAEADLRERRLEAALNGFSSVQKALPNNARAQTGMAETYLAMGNAELALKTYAALPQHAAEQPQALQGRGIAALLLGDEAAALQYLSRAVEADPSLWRAWNTLGMLHARTRNWAQADVSYQRAAQANPGAAEIHNNHGFSLIQRGDYAAAIPLLTQALKIDPAMEAARNNLTLATALQGRYETALAAIPSEALPVALNNIGYAAMMRRDYPTAESYLTRAVQSSPRHFAQANENLRWLTYLRGTAPEDAKALPKVTKGSSPVQLVPTR